MKIEQTHRFQTLDGWRGIGALAVAILHFDALWHFYGYNFTANLQCFVDFFFVLSGFVIAYSYSDRMGTARDFVSFIVKRFGRLWPLHATILLVLILRECVKLYLTMRLGDLNTHPAFTGPTSVHAIWTNVLLLNAFGLDQANSTWNSPSWSIGAEFYTYIVFALGCLIAGRRSPLWSAATALLAAAIVWLYSPHFMAGGHYGFFRCLYGFGAGTLVYWVFKNLPRIEFGTATEAVTLIVVVLYFALTSHTAINMVSPAIFSLAVYVFAVEGGFFSRVLKMKWPNRLGLWSYSIYMVHVPIFMTLMFGPARVLERLFHRPFMVPIMEDGVPTDVLLFWNKWGGDLALLAYLAIVVSVASLTYRYIEVTARAYFNGIASRFAMGETKKPRAA